MNLKQQHCLHDHELGICRALEVEIEKCEQYKNTRYRVMPHTLEAVSNTAEDWERTDMSVFVSVSRIEDDKDNASECKWQMHEGCDMRQSYYYIIIIARWSSACHVPPELLY